MLVSQAHSFTQQARLAITLAWVAGYTNIVTVLACGTVTSHVSGTASNLGRDVAEGSWPLAGFMLFLLASFFAGAALSAVLTETGRRRGWESIYVLPVLVEAALLTGLAVGIELHDPTQRASGGTLWLLTGVASVAMGLQNATITRISSGVIRTTHLTGVLTDLGSESVQFLLWLSDRRKNREPLSADTLIHSVGVHPTARRLALLASIVGSFAFGAGLGALAFDHVPVWSMVPPVAFLLWIIWQDISAPICEIEASELLNEEAGLGLPAGLAVYHLRKDQARHGRKHRLPDLLRWCERLPLRSRVVVLDLGDVPQMDANAALELRALVRQAQANGRRMVISGLSPGQFAALRLAGAADTLDAQNVCPDLELAIARGVALLEEHPA
jgi:uncharacterized membrane protein YoaK (UPF0700 family)/anti-anti-sigma regulatory factor